MYIIQYVTYRKLIIVILYMRAHGYISIRRRRRRRRRRGEEGREGEKLLLFTVMLSYVIAQHILLVRIFMARDSH